MHTYANAYTYKCCGLLLDMYIIFSSLSLSQTEGAAALFYISKILVTRILHRNINSLCSTRIYTYASLEPDSRSPYELHYFVSIRTYQLAAAFTRTYTMVTTNEIQIWDWSHGDKYMAKINWWKEIHQVQAPMRPQKYPHDILNLPSYWIIFN